MAKFLGSSLLENQSCAGTLHHTITTTPLTCKGKVETALYLLQSSHFLLDSIVGGGRVLQFAGEREQRRRVGRRAARGGRRARLLGSLPKLRLEDFVLVLQQVHLGLHALNRILRRKETWR